MLIIKPKYNKKITKSTIQTSKLPSNYGAHEQKKQEAPSPKRKRIEKLINGKGIIYE